MNSSDIHRTVRFLPAFTVTGTNIAFADVSSPAPKCCGGASSPSSQKSASSQGVIPGRSEAKGKGIHGSRALWWIPLGSRPEGGLFATPSRASPGMTPVKLRNHGAKSR
jgi:hypothetical protein